MNVNTSRAGGCGNSCRAKTGTFVEYVMDSEGRGREHISFFPSLATSRHPQTKNFSEKEAAISPPPISLTFPPAPHLERSDQLSYQKRCYISFPPPPSPLSHYHQVEHHSTPSQNLSQPAHRTIAASATTNSTGLPTTALPKEKKKIPCP